MVQIETLPNGVRIVTEPMDTVRSAALGIWVGGGSREEAPSESGAAHFIEHMLFKGTQRRSAQDIARETDAIGGQMNAFTTKECTCFYGRVLDSHLPQALDILFDMVYHSSFAQEAVETERGVILEEIDMYEDTPDDLCAEKLFGAVFQGSALARPILGSAETLAPMTGEFLREYHRAHYRGDNTVVALSGSFSQEILDELRRRFAALPAGAPQPVVPAVYTPAFVVTSKPIEQNHLTLAFPGLDYNSPKRFALQLLSSILGGGVSSRLFQQVRERQGLCYTIYSYGAGHADTGVFCIYTALNKETEAKALATIRQVVDQLRAAYGERPVSFTTDCICGFPGETQADFEESCEFLKKIGFLKVHVFPYSRRSGTPAYDFPEQVHEREKQERSRVMNAIAEEVRREVLAAYVGTEDDVLLETPLSGTLFTGYTRLYIPVVVSAPGHESGQIVHVTLGEYDGERVRAALC